MIVLLSLYAVCTSSGDVAGPISGIGTFVAKERGGSRRPRITQFPASISLSLSLSLPICLRAHECLMRRNLLCVARPLSPPPQSVSRTKPPNRQGKRCLRIKCESINQQPWFDFNNQLSELRKLMRNMRMHPSLLVLFKIFITCCLTQGAKFSMCLKSKFLIMSHFEVVNTSRALDLSPFGRDMNN